LLVTFTEFTLLVSFFSQEKSFFSLLLVTFVVTLTLTIQLFFRKLISLILPFILRFYYFWEMRCRSSSMFVASPMSSAYSDMEPGPLARNSISFTDMSLRRSTSSIYTRSSSLLSLIGQITDPQYQSQELPRRYSSEIAISRSEMERYLMPQSNVEYVESRDSPNIAFITEQKNKKISKLQNTKNNFFSFLLSVDKKIRKFTKKFGKSKNTKREALLLGINPETSTHTIMRPQKVAPFTEAEMLRFLALQTTLSESSISEFVRANVLAQQIFDKKKSIENYKNIFSDEKASLHDVKSAAYVLQKKEQELESLQSSANSIARRFISQLGSSYSEEFTSTSNLYTGSESPILPMEPQMGIFPTLVSQEVNDAMGDFFGNGAGVFSKLSETIPNLDAVLNNQNLLIKQLQDISSKENISDLLSRAGITVDEVVKELANKMDVSNLVQKTYGAFSLIMLISALMYAVTKKDRISFVLVIFATITAVYFNRDEVLKLLAVVSPWFENMTPQMEGVEPLLDGVTMVLSSFVLKEAPLHKLPQTMWDHLKTFSTVKTNVKSIVNFFFQALEIILSKSGYAHLLPDWARRVDVSDPEIKQLFIDYDKLMETYNNNLLPLTRTNAAIVQNIHRKFTDTIRTVPNSAATISLRESLKIELLKINKLVEVFRAAKLTDDGKRIEPVAVILAGTPGNFKSQTVEILMADIQKRELDESQWAEVQKDNFRYVYARDQTSGYWDGYRDPFVVVFDDLGQSVTVAGALDNEFSDWMKCKGELPLRLHMASINEKSSTYFKARYMLATTNFPTPRIETINSLEAFQRRVDFAFYMTPKPEFCTPETKNHTFMEQKLDKNHPKLPRGPEGVILTHPKHHSRFIRYDPKNPSQTLGTFTYEEMLELILKKGEDYAKFFKQKRFEVEQVMAERPLQPQGLFDLPEKEEEPVFEFKAVYDTLDDYGKKIFDAILLSIKDKEEFSNVMLKAGLIRRFLCNYNNSEDIYMRTEMLVLKFFLVTRGEKVARYFDKDQPLTTFVELLDDFFRDKIYKWEDIQINMLGPELKPTNYFRKVWDTANKLLTENVFTPAKEHFSGALLYWKKYSTTILTVLGLASTLAGVYYATSSNKISGNFEPLPEEEVSKILDEEREGKKEEVQFVPEIEEGIMFDEDQVVIPTQTSQAFSSTDYFAKSRTGKVKGKAKSVKSAAKYLKGTEAFKWNAFAETQMAYTADPQAQLVAKAIMQKNLLLLELRATPTSEFTRMGHMLIVKDRACVTIKHFHGLIKAFLEEKTLTEASTIKISFVSCNKYKFIDTFMTVPDFLNSFTFTEALSLKDLAMFTLPPDSARNFKSCMTKIATQKEHENLNEFSGFLYGFEKEEEGNKFNMCCFHARPVQQVPIKDKYVGEYKISRGYFYAAPTDKGDCGTPLYFHNRKLPESRVFGLHVAGYMGQCTGMSSALVREEVEEGLAQISKKVILVEEEVPLVPQMDYSLSNNQFTAVAQLDVKINSPSKTNIRKSPLYGAWGPALTKPARLTKFVNKVGIEKDPREIALSKYGGNGFIISQAKVNLLTDIYYNDLMAASEKIVEPRVLTFEEAVLGIENDDDFDSISRNTSPGFPFILDKEIVKMGGKKYWFGNSENFDMENDRVEKLKLETEMVENYAKKGIRRQHVFVDCLKDERRPINKVEDGKTRMFSTTPLIYLILVRKYFGTFVSTFVKNRINNGSAIGVNPYSTEWQALADKLTQFGENNIGAGDYSAFDGSEKPIIHSMILEIINRFYPNATSEENLVRTVLWAELVNSKHAFGDILYQWVSSLPSGHPLTAIVNTLYNGIALRFAWAEAVEWNVLLCSLFSSYVYMIALGDDNAFGVHDDFKHVFNEMTLGTHLAKIGLTYTTELKGVATIPLRHISEIAFLKRKFIYNPELCRIVAPIDIKVILETPYWTKESDKWTITKDNFEFALSELSLHGKETFELYASKMIPIARTILSGGGLQYTPIRHTYMSNLLFVCAEQYVF